MTSPKTPIIIAHRGASGYLPEHTLEAKAMAHALGADYLEQDLVLTSDGVPIVLHDIHLDTVTNVAHLFPGRKRADGRYYAIDFTLAEIRQLTVSERFDPKTGNAVFPNRFPAHKGSFRIPTFAEELVFIQGLNKSTGRVAGIYPEIKQPSFHHKAGQDITRIVLTTLGEYGYTTKNDPCFLQCFDFAECRRIRHEFGSQLKLIQLLEERDLAAGLEHPSMLPEQMREIAKYADGIGPNILSVLPPKPGHPRAVPFPETGYLMSLLVDAAHAAGLVVHPWTLRKDSLPKHFDDFLELHQDLVQVGIDGAFSDFPDLSAGMFHRAVLLPR